MLARKNGLASRPPVRAIRKSGSRCRLDFVGYALGEIGRVRSVDCEGRRHSDEECERGHHARCGNANCGHDGFPDRMSSAIMSAPGVAENQPPVPLLCSLAGFASEPKNVLAKGFGPTIDRPSWNRNARDKSLGTGRPTESTSPRRRNAGLAFRFGPASHSGGRWAGGFIASRMSIGSGEPAEN